MAEQRRIEPRDLLAFKLAGDVQMAPGGDRAAYVLSWTNQEKNQSETGIYVVAPGRQPVRYTGHDTDRAPRWRPDGEQLAFLSCRSGQAQIWVLPAGGEAWQLTKVQGGVNEFAWAPDGSRIAFIANLEKEGIQPEKKDDDDKDLYKKHTKGVKVITELYHKEDGEGYFTAARPQVCVVAVAPDAQPAQLTQPPYFHSGLSWAPDGSHLLFLANREPGEYDRPDVSYVYRIPAGGGTPERLTGPELSAGTAAYTPDGSQIVFLATEPRWLGTDNGLFYIMPAAGGAPRLLTPGFDRSWTNESVNDMPPPGSAPIQFSPDGRWLYGLVSAGGTVHLHRLELATGQVAPLTFGDQVVYSYSLDRAAGQAVLGVAGPLHPGDIYWLDLAGGGAPTRLTEINRDLLAQLELSQPTRFRAQAPGGPEVDAWAMAPAGWEEGRRYPTVLQIHGGPMAQYACMFFMEFQLLAARGFGVLYSNPRGSQGYGRAFCSAISGTEDGIAYADLMAVVDQGIRAHPWVDPDRLGVAGGSYGGQMTAWIVGHTDRFKAAVAMRGVYEWRAFYGTTDGSWFWYRVGGRASGKEQVFPWHDEPFFRTRSPFTYVENIRTPLLIEHQEMDLRAPLEQAQLLYAALKYLDRAPVKMVLYPGESHGMSRNGKPWHRVHRLEQIAGWFSEHLQQAGA